MARKVKQVGRVLIYVLPLVILGVLLMGRPRQLRTAATFSLNPFWTTSAVQECGCNGCGCPAPSVFTYGVSTLTGEVVEDRFLFSFPVLGDDFVVSLRWRSMVSGNTQFGQGVIPSFLRLLKVVSASEAYVLNPVVPTGMSAV